jgi:hypothetical protein
MVITLLSMAAMNLSSIILLAQCAISQYNMRVCYDDLKLKQFCMLQTYKIVRHISIIWTNNQ